VSAGDLLAHNRACVSAAYRRLADSALAAAEQYDNANTIGDETRIANGVAGRMDSVKHALAIVHATREGISRVSVKRGAA
jgi:hypothetical protein